MDFDAVAYFGPNIAVTPGPRDLFMVMEASEPQYQEYITMFVWTAPPEGTIFADVMEVTFRAKEGQF